MKEVKGYQNKGRDTWEVEMLFEDLLNEENEHNLEEINVVEGPIEVVSEKEVKKSLKEMKSVQQDQ